MSTDYQKVDVEMLDYDEVLPRVGELFDELMSHPDAGVRDRVEEMMDLMDAFHREGLGRLVEMIRAWRGEIFLEAVAADELAGVLLAAYGLGENRDVAARSHAAVAEALEVVRPTVESHGGAIEVDDIVDGVVRVRLSGTCDGCPSSQATLTFGLQVALQQAWPSFRRLEVVNPPSAVDAARAALACVTVDSEPAPTVLVQIRGHERA